MKIETQQRIARNLKIIRVSNGLNQTQMAEYSGVSRAVYLSYENGKLYDDGLVKLINNYKDLSSFAKGMLIENAVAQMLASTGKKLYFYSSYSQNAEDRMEIDFLTAKSSITSRHNISPIEVKSSTNYTLSSLNKFRSKFSEYIHQPYVLHTADLIEKDGVIYLPLYMAILL